MIGQEQVLNILAAKAKKAKADAPGDDGGFAAMRDLYLDCQVELERTQAALKASCADTAREREAHAKQVLELQQQLANANAALDAAKANPPAPAAPPAPTVVRDDVAIEALRSECSDLRVANARLTTKCEGLESQNQILRDQHKRDETKLAKRDAAPVPAPAPPEPVNCDIEVVRGADDRIRTLKVRYE